jgi:hypothetical protein
MSGTDIAGKLIRHEAPVATAEATPDLSERLAWPAAALLILLLSAGLWLGIAMLLNTLVG